MKTPKHKTTIEAAKGYAWDVGRGMFGGIDRRIKAEKDFLAGVKWMRKEMLRLNRNPK